MLQEYLDQLFDAFKEGICISDVEGTVVHLNRRHAEITGIPREEMLGHSVMEFVRRGRLDVVLNPEVMRTGQPATRVQTVSDGRKLILEANPGFDAQGKLVLCITFLRDVTMLSEMREQMSVQKELLEAFQQLSTAGDAQELSRKTPKLFTSSAMIKLYGEVNTIAETDATVLLLGESGTGKELAANTIHAGSPRAGHPFIKINCAALPEGLIESELFGHEKGAFTGAVGMRKGRFEAADGGTLFLDEIGELAVSTQVKLLRVLQEQEFERLGGMETRKVDVRVVAATSRNLEQMVKDGLFRRDLYYRLNVFPVSMPPLRERQGDIPLLVENFLEKYGHKIGKRGLRVAPEAEALLLAHSWPGNIRELENVIERAVILTTDGLIRPDLLPPAMQAPCALCSLRGTLPDALEQLERQLITEALQEHRGNMGHAAQALGISERVMGLRMRKFGLGYKAFRRGAP